LILSPIGLILISAARLIVVSNYNTTTAVTVATSSGYVNTLLGSVIPLIPVFAPYVALILLLFKRFFLSIIAFIFTAFITPTPLKLPQLLNTVQADWQQLVSLISEQRLTVIATLLIIVSILWNYHRSLAEAVRAVMVVLVTFALLFLEPGQQVSLVARANAGEHQNEHRLLSLASVDWRLTIVVALIVIFAILSYYTLLGAASTVIAIIATFALLPYVINIYPFPHQRNYYVEALHQLWLPAQRIVLSSGLIYSGYVLSSDHDWFTVLLTNKTIKYLHTAAILKRSVCQPRTDPEPPPYPPLISLLYTPPQKTLVCPLNPVSPRLIFIRSQGQSLRKISTAVHRSPWTIISVTNGHEQEELSAALRAYERKRDWNAPTPVGQRFWYYPRIPSRSASSGHHQRRTTNRPLLPITNVCILPLCIGQSSAPLYQISRP